MVLTGRGGFGNFSSKPSTPSSNTPPTSTPTSTASPQLAPSTTSPSPSSTPQQSFSAPPVQVYTSPSQTVRTGRGGAGNHVPISQVASETPQEYLKQVETAIESAPQQFHVGRGGSGNFTGYAEPFVKGGEEEGR